MNIFGKVVFGVVTFSLGALAGYIYGKKVSKSEFDNNLSELREFYREKNEGNDEKSDEEPDSEITDAEIDDIIDTYKGGKRRYTIEPNKPSLEEYAASIFPEGTSVIVEKGNEAHLGEVENFEEEDGEEDKDDFYDDYHADLEAKADEYIRRKAENFKNGNPYLIEPEEYHQGPEDYERQTLYYYVEDRTLCEDDDSMIEIDIEEECVGFDYEDKLDMQTTAWVRNDRLKVLYEIHKVSGSYKKEVLGVVETPREREFRIQGRRRAGLDNG